MVAPGARSRSAITLVVLALVLALGVSWGWSRVTDSYPTPLESLPCTDQPVRAGDPVRRDQVMVSVLNASERRGLARKTMNRLMNRNFAEGEIANARASSATAPVVIWGNPEDAAARLVATQFSGRARVVEQPSSYPGITIVLGKSFRGLKKGKKRIIAKADTTVCMPS